MKLTFSAITLILLCSHSSESKSLDSLTTLNFIKPKIVNFIDSGINGTACASDLKIFIDDLSKFKWWALRMFDASTKWDSGLLEGNMKLYGQYDQCLSVQKRHHKSVINGQYCTVTLVPQEKSVRAGFDLVRKFINDSNWKRKNVDWDNLLEYTIYYYGLCVPKSCTVTDLNNLWQHMEKFVKFPFEAKFLEESCHYKDKPVASNSRDYCVILFFAFILTVELVSTVYDIYLQKSGKEPNAFVSFSIYTNTKRLLSKHGETEALSCLYGIKVISMIWVITAHIAMYKVDYTNNSAYAVLQWTTHFKNSPILASPYAVDIFFSISGLLVVYVYLSYSQKVKINFLMLYMHRILRLVPTLLATVLINISLSKYFFWGPYAFMSRANLITNCEKHWWATLFFVNNLVPLRQQCVPQTWYLSVDTHMYILAPLLMYCMTKNAQKTLLGICVIIALSSIYTWTLVVNNNFGHVIYWEMKREIPAAYTYLSTICRMPAWLIGTIFGYLIYDHNLKKIRISKNANFVLWALSLFTMTTLILCHTMFFTEEHNVYRSAFFHTFSKLLWCLSICYIIYSCCTGQGGRINDFLSHYAFTVLGKLTYSMFLIHITVIYTIMANRKHPGYFSNFEIFFEGWGYFALSLIGATVLCLVVEMPVLSFLRHLEIRKRKKVK